MNRLRKGRKGEREIDTFTAPEASSLMHTDFQNRYGLITVFNNTFAFFNRLFLILDYRKERNSIMEKANKKKKQVHNAE